MWKRLRSCFTCGGRASNRSGSPDKLAKVSSSSESDAPESRREQYGKQVSDKNKTNIEGKRNETNSLGHKNEGGQGLQSDESEENVTLRHRVSARKGESEGETKVNLLSSESVNKAVESENENKAASKNNLSEALSASRSRELDKQGSETDINTKTNNVEILDKSPERKSIAGTNESAINCKQKPGEFVEEDQIQGPASDGVKFGDNRQDDDDEANINKASDVLLNESLISESKPLQKAKRLDVVVKEPALQVKEVIPSESAVEFQAENENSLAGRELIAGEFCDDLHSDVIAIDSSQPSGTEVIDHSGDEEAIVEEIRAVNDGIKHINLSSEESVEINHVNEVSHNEESILDPHVNDVNTENVIEEFSHRLSKCIMDAVLQDAQLLFNQSEDEGDESRNRESILKFSDILSESIIRSVLDYSKVGEVHIPEHDEPDRMSPSVAEINTNEKTSHDVPYGSSPTNEEEVYSGDEANDESCSSNLHEYAKALSQQILTEVLDMNGDRSQREMTDVYTSKLTKSVLSNAINGAKSHIVESQSLTDSDVGMDNEAIDFYIAEIVGNAVESAMSRIAEETSKNAMQQNGIEGDHDSIQGEYSECHVENNIVTEDHLGTCRDQDVREHNEDSGGYVVKTEGPSRGLQNGKVDTPGVNIDHCQNKAGIANGLGNQVVQQNGKLQSKWLSEDDLDELYNEDLSDEDETAGASTDTDQNTSGDVEPVTSANNLTTPNNEKQFWRKSLIEDLDDDMDFEEIETPRSSSSSSPTKSANLEDFVVDGSAESEDDEVLETSSNNVKVQKPIANVTESSRSRLRSVDTTPVLVLDSGSAFQKVGFSDQALPKEIVSSVVGTPLRYSQDISGMEYSSKQGLIFGDNAMSKAGVLHIQYPLKSDLVERWADVEGLWNYILGTLMSIQENPDFPILISQPGLNPKKNAEKIAEIMFEHFHMPSIFIADQLALSLFSMGYTSGLSFSSGFKSTQAGVVYEGHVLPHTVKQLDIAGYQLTENLKKLLMSLQGFGFRSSSQWQIVDDIKKKLGFFSLDFDADSKRYKTQADLQTTYELPDGQVIEVGLERFGCAESLFKPMEVGLTQSPAHMLINEAINSCEHELQELCYKAMGVSGGTTQMTGFLPRLEQELRKVDRQFKSFTAPEERGLSTWLGGAVVASLPTFREMVVSVDEYAESGARVVHSKCF
ncbi:POTE ankyrin domain family member J-like isoform X2 [Dendronephthya gigantea]|uniref:POTE ankyrin domain family member J-like isoform X2 n=1 Tax=Dendronephthya gigantea TaxID=151771 RepID=UPI00106B914A|nr:POTE ankyrin domain family member J-like isoform X2 [Dendronephthya gigantea]